MKSNDYRNLFGIGRCTFIIFVVIIIIIAVFSAFVMYYYNPSTTITTSTTSSPVPFFMNLTTRPIKPASIDESHNGMLGIVGQQCIFLVSIIEQSGGDFGPVQISVLGGEEMADVHVSPKQIRTGQVAEIIVVPKTGSVGTNLTFTIVGERDNFVQTETVFVEVIDWEDSIGSTAAEIRDKFIPWLSANYPELGITNATRWEGTIVNPRLLVVMHYMFLSKDWEMYVTWHVMVPPNDWAKVYLRHRFNETQSSYAFEISSVEGGLQPHPIELPDWV